VEEEEIKSKIFAVLVVGGATQDHSFMIHCLLLFATAAEDVCVFLLLLTIDE